MLAMFLTLALLACGVEAIQQRQGASTPPSSARARTMFEADSWQEEEGEEEKAGGGFNLSLGNGRPPNRRCKMNMCHMHDKSAPTLYVWEGRLDGTASRAKALFQGLNLAAQNSMNFGGIMETKHGQYHSIDNHDYGATLDSFFGEGAYEELHMDLNVQDDVPSFDSVIPMAEFAHQSSSFLPGSNVLVPDALFPIHFEPDTDLAKAMRSNLIHKPLKFASNRPTVAIHVRRGDVQLNSATPDSVFLEIVDKLRQQIPSADIHVWSSASNDRSRQNTKDIPYNWTSADFDVYRKHGMTVHLDDADLADVWTHFVRADVLVVDRSSFSGLPALLNPNLVICDVVADQCRNSHHLKLQQVAGDALFDTPASKAFHSLVTKFGK